MTGGGECAGGLAECASGARVSAGLGAGECVVLGVGVCESALPDTALPDLELGVLAASAGAAELLGASLPAPSVAAEGGLPSVIAGGPLGADCDGPLGTGAVGSVELVAVRARASSARLMV